MIYSTRPIVMPVATIVFCFVFLDLKSGDGRTTCAKTMIPTGLDFGLAEWINKTHIMIHQRWFTYGVFGVSTMTF